MTRTDLNWVRFKTLRDFLVFLVTSRPAVVQFYSALKYKRCLYTFIPTSSGAIVLYTEEEPKAAVYVWDPERGDFLPSVKAERTKVNVMVVEVTKDTMIDSKI